MWLKEENGQLIPPPVNFKTEAGWIMNFNQNPEAMTAHGWQQRSLPEKQISREELSELIYDEKCKIAYGGITLNKNGTAYLFDTDPTSISMCNSMMLRLTGQPDDTPVSWKVYADGAPVLLQLTKQDFEAVFAAGMAMINSAFTVEGELNTELGELDPAGYETFRAGIAARFAEIERMV